LPLAAGARSASPDVLTGGAGQAISMLTATRARSNWQLLLEIALRIGRKLIRLHVPEHCDRSAFAVEVGE
jgi:hypothetical protein